MNADLNSTLWMQTLKENRSKDMEQDKLKTLAQEPIFKCHQICRRKRAIENLITTSDNRNRKKKKKRKERLEKETLEI
jgi:hypothetical protein